MPRCLVGRRGGSSGYDPAAASWRFRFLAALFGGAPHPARIAFLALFSALIWPTLPVQAQEDRISCVDSLAVPEPESPAVVRDCETLINDIETPLIGTHPSGIRYVNWSRDLAMTSWIAIGIDRSGRVTLLSG